MISELVTVYIPGPYEGGVGKPLAILGKKNKNDDATSTIDVIADLKTKI